MVKVSVIIPAFNEEGTIESVVKEVLDYPRLHEVIVVDDGSTDKTAELVEKLIAADSRVKLVSHKVNKGKTQALKTGLNESSGDVIVTMDADLQYDPAEIPRLVEPIAKGKADITNGWRIRRADPLTRRLASGAYNWLIRRLFSVKIKDNNSGFKAFRKEALTELSAKLRGELHRYVIPLASHEGYRIVEVPVSHAPRRFGRTKYASLRRLLTGFFDVIALKLLLVFQERPMRLFGLSGGALAFLGLLIGVYLLHWKLVLGLPLTPRLPLVISAMTLIVVGLLLFLLGFLAEMIASLREELKRR